MSNHLLIVVFQKPWGSNQNWPPEAAEMYYLIGMCHMEKKDYVGAHDAFNNSIRVDSKYAEVCKHKFYFLFFF